jgi:hypothetical protein
MSDTPFPPELRRALDSFAPPPLPADFAERVAEKARQRQTAPDLPHLRRPAPRWRRAGWIAGGIASLSLVSAAAAATGVFGEPVHVPVISQIAQSLDIVPAPAERAVEIAGSPEPREPAMSEPASPRERLDALLDDPEFRALPPARRRAELRQTARELIASGEATPREVVSALRDTARERVAQLPPEQQERIEEAVVERRAARQDIRREVLAATPAERRELRRQLLRERLSEWRERRLEQEAAVSPPTDVAAPVEETAPPGEGADAVVR